ncbi:MAG: hypothetical protein ABJG47_11960 [Ekhidna sp.]
MKKLINITLTVFTLVFISCERPDCANTNSIFENSTPESSEYKAELVQQLQSTDQAKLTYWLQKYETRNGKEYLSFYIQGDGLCAILDLTMNHWTKLGDVREKKGVTYRGAEFTNLKFDIVEDSSTTEFIYQSFDHIID